MAPGTTARVVGVDFMGWNGREPHPARQEIGKVVEILEEVPDPAAEEYECKLYLCALLDFTRREMVFTDYELQER